MVVLEMGSILGQEVALLAPIQVAVEEGHILIILAQVGPVSWSSPFHQVPLYRRINLRFFLPRLFRAIYTMPLSIMLP